MARDTFDGQKIEAFARDNARDVIESVAGLLDQLRPLVGNVDAIQAAGVVAVLLPLTQQARALASYLQTVAQAQAGQRPAAAAAPLPA